MPIGVFIACLKRCCGILVLKLGFLKWNLSDNFCVLCEFQKMPLLDEAFSNCLLRSQEGRTRSPWMCEAFSTNWKFVRCIVHCTFMLQTLTVLSSIELHRPFTDGESGVACLRHLSLPSVSGSLIFSPRFCRWFSSYLSLGSDTTLLEVGDSLLSLGKCTESGLILRVWNSKFRTACSLVKMMINYWRRSLLLILRNDF